MKGDFKSRPDEAFGVPNDGLAPSSMECRELFDRRRRLGLHLEGEVSAVLVWNVGIRKQSDLHAAEKEHKGNH